MTTSQNREAGDPSALDGTDAHRRFYNCQAGYRSGDQQLCVMEAVMLSRIVWIVLSD
jgi:hypothetical protein